MIAYVKKSYNHINVYDETGKFLFNKCGELVGYTSNTVSIKSNTGTVWTYSCSGRVLFSR